MPGVPRARVSQMRRGRVSVKSLWVDEHLVDRVEARCVHALCARMTAASATSAGGSAARRSSTPTSMTDGRAKARWTRAAGFASPEAGAARGRRAVHDRGRGCVKKADGFLCGA
jgi:hypothetical protein